MRLTFGGVRGTNPVAQVEFMRYGGETTSFLVEGQGGEQILIDAGTGVRELGRRLAASAAPPRLLMLMTHYHLDHVVGLPSLGLIYSPHWTLEIAAPAHEDVVVAETMSRIMDRPFWPLQVEDLKSRLRFTALEQDPAAVLHYGGLEIRWCPLHHPGGCTAYRIDEPATGAALVVATDVEWGTTPEAFREALLDLCAKPRPAQLLVMDAQYTPEEAGQYRGWGHSTWPEAAEVARRAGIGRLLLTHHDPRRNDDDLDALRRTVQAAEPWVDLARERVTVQLS